MSAVLAASVPAVVYASYCGDIAQAAAEAAGKRAEDCTTGCASKPTAQEEIECGEGCAKTYSDDMQQISNDFEECVRNNGC